MAGIQEMFGSLSVLYNMSAYIYNVTTIHGNAIGDSVLS